MTTTLPDDLKTIERPTIRLGRSEKPVDFDAFKIVRYTAAFSFGWGVELRVHPDGRCLEFTTAKTTYPRFRIFSSIRAWEINDRSCAMRDPEGHGGRFFPTDYPRLRIVRQEMVSIISATGYQHAPDCDCSACGISVSYHIAKYAHSETEGYFPFCPKCYGVFLDI